MRFLTYPFLFLNKPRLRVLFLHGLHSNQWGAKSLALIARGHDVLTPELPGDWTTAVGAKIPFLFSGRRERHWNNALQIAEESYEAFEPDVVVGSSRGGAIAMALVQKQKAQVPHVLVAPAWRLFGVKPIVGEKCIIYHGTLDTLVSIEDSRELQRKNPQAVLIEVEDDHQVNGHLFQVMQSVENLAMEMKRPNSKPPSRPPIGF
jgi:predicted esterase